MSSKETPPKLIVVLGPTASGKTGLGIALAKKFDGEVISADSRQVYKEFDIGTAKPRGHYMRLGGKNVFVADGIPHHLVDFVDPKEEFSLRDFKDKALAVIRGVLGQGKLPIIVGGTALYIYSVTENMLIPDVPPNNALRVKLERQPAEKLYQELVKKDPQAAEITGINKRRIIRALEVIGATGQTFSSQRKKGPKLFEVLKIGPEVPKEELHRRIETRIGQMIEEGLVEEVERLAKKYSWELPPMQSIDYQEFKDYIEGKEELSSVIKKLARAHKDLARRQMTWFGKDKDVKWVKDEEAAEELVKEFLI